MNGYNKMDGWMDGFLNGWWMSGWLIGRANKNYFTKTWK